MTTDGTPQLTLPTGEPPRSSLLGWKLHHAPMFVLLKIVHVCLDCAYLSKYAPSAVFESVITPRVVVHWSTVRMFRPVPPA